MRKAADSVYDVWLRCDSNSTDLGWFYFRMHNNAHTKVTINIVNLTDRQNPHSFVSHINSQALTLTLLKGSAPLFLVKGATKVVRQVVALRRQQLESPHFKVHQQDQLVQPHPNANLLPILIHIRLFAH